MKKFILVSLLLLFSPVAFAGVADSLADILFKMMKGQETASLHSASRNIKPLLSRLEPADMSALLPGSDGSYLGTNLRGESIFVSLPQFGGVHPAIGMFQKPSIEIRVGRELNKSELPSTEIYNNANFTARGPEIKAYADYYRPYIQESVERLQSEVYESLIYNGVQLPSTKPIVKNTGFNIVPILEDAPGPNAGGKMLVTHYTLDLAGLDVSVINDIFQRLLL